MKNYIVFIIIVILVNSCDPNYGKYGGYKFDYTGPIR